jgi:hypothetical protein
MKNRLDFTLASALAVLECLSLTMDLLFDVRLCQELEPLTLKGLVDLTRSYAFRGL